ncbi:DUF3800 domain-containing protein [Bradyrhizobium sp. WU425]|uniref:DUF3800 domain-containing protein n=1 Tax=Bradyrhizobium sp. WU425 TaxID=187029 RepID=UPI001E654AD9|nr:DUF3800 domain-containing protein [Bradyrhizobium canariense]UFW73041.1 DUF3800 domain-containing protein [Bradyrhizobium canariense]
MHYLFIDESGELGLHERSSEFFLIAALCTENLKALEKRVWKEKAKLINEATSSRPTHRIYAVTRTGNKKIWRSIGALWPHGDGKGFNHKVDCLPLNGAEIVIREIDAEGEEGAP